MPLVRRLKPSPGACQHPSDILLPGRPLMCRNIRNLYNFKPPATDEEILASSLQFVRKLSGFNPPSKANEEAFNRAVATAAQAAREPIGPLVTTAPPRAREDEPGTARARAT